MSQVVISDVFYINPSGRQVWVSKIGDEKIDRALLWKVSRDSSLMRGIFFGFLFVGFLGSEIGLISGVMPDKNFESNGNKDLLNPHFPDLDKRAFWRQPR